MREAVLPSYFTGGESAGSLSERFSLGGSSVVYVWAQRYRNDYRHLLSDTSGNVSGEEKECGSKSVLLKEKRASSRQPLKAEDLEKHVAELEAALDYERMRSCTYEKLIEVAERDLCINIKKVWRQTVSGMRIHYHSRYSTGQLVWFVRQQPPGLLRPLPSV